jgi:hypothetical protein
MAIRAGLRGHFVQFCHLWEATAGKGKRNKCMGGGSEKIGNPQSYSYSWMEERSTGEVHCCKSFK